MRLHELLVLMALLAVSVPNASAVIDSAQVDAVVEQVRQDPQLATERNARVPTWTGKAWDWSRNKDKPEAPGPIARALATFFGFVFGAGRWLFIAALVLLFALLVLYVVRNLRLRAGWRKATSVLLPTHVHDLDVRPESLPSEIGAAAWQLWEQGRTRDALSLLYRGLLSRMVYQYAVPVRDSSTEGDCRQYASSHLPEIHGRFAGKLIGLWQRGIYGAKTPTQHQFRELCTDFDVLMPLSQTGSRQ